MSDPLGRDIPGRPDDPELGHLQEIVLWLDAQAEDGVPVGIVAAEYIPTAVLDYVCQHRTARVITKVATQFLHPLQERFVHALMAATWNDAFVAGCRYYQTYLSDQQHPEH